MTPSLHAAGIDRARSDAGSTPATRIRVTHLISGDAWGGAEALALQLIHAQQRRGDIEPSCLLLNEGQLSQALVQAGVKVAIADERVHGLPALASRARSLLDEMRPDIIHSHRDKENLLAAFARWRSKSGRRPRLLTTLHGMPEPFSGIRGLRRGAALFLDRTLCRHVFDAVICVSHDMRSRIGADYGPTLQVVHNGIELPRPDAFPARAAIPARSMPIRLIAAGRLVPIKRFERLAELAGLLASRAPGRFEIVLAGDGPERERLAQSCSHLPPGALRMAGFVNGPLDALAPVHGLLIVSDSEGMPISALEAAARGIPVFSFRVGGIPELFAADIAGALAPPGDVASLANSVLSYFDSEHAPASIPGPGWHFSIDQCAERYASIYRQLLESSRGPG